MKELRRQLAHMTGFLLVPGALIFGTLFAGIVSFIAGAIIFAYSLHVKRRQESGLLWKMEKAVTRLFFFFERERPSWPFMGAFSLFFSSAIAFFLLPQNQALAAVSVVTLGDGLSTLVGYYFGKRKLVGNKTLEGTLAFFIASLSSLAFVPLPHALLVSLLATLAELSTAAAFVRKSRFVKYIDDNWLVTVVCAVALQAASMLFAA